MILPPALYPLHVPIRLRARQEVRELLAVNPPSRLIYLVPRRRYPRRLSVLRTVWPKPRALRALNIWPWVLKLLTPLSRVKLDRAVLCPLVPPKSLWPSLSSPTCCWTADRENFDPLETRLIARLKLTTTRKFRVRLQMARLDCRTPLTTTARTRLCLLTLMTV